MAELEIRGEFDALGGTNVAVGDKDHIGHRSSGKDDAADELADKVEAIMLICDGHDDRNRQEHNSSDP